MQLTLEQIVVGVGAAVIGGLLVVIWYFIRMEREELRRRMAENEARAEERYRRTSQQQDQLRSDLHQLRDTMPDRYVSKMDFVEFKGWLTGMLMRIEKKLDGKQDRD